MQAVVKVWRVAVLVLLSACAAVPPPTPPLRTFYQDARFKPATLAVSEAEIFKLNPAMQAFLDDEVARQARLSGPRQGLIDALYRKRQLLLDYDSSSTRTAAEAFDSREGNCLSLVIMTAAFAKALRIPVVFNVVALEESWLRSGDLYLMAGHVNLTLGRQIATMDGFGVELNDMTIDFIPREALRGARSRAISEAQVVAMYFNNRAAELMVDGDIDNAYWMARAATQADPQYLNAYNTLGVVYRRHGDLAAAEQVLRRVLALEPDDMPSLGNLAMVLKAEGQFAESSKLSARLAQLQPYPPYVFFDQGIVAMRDGHYDAARDLFQREIERDAFVHEFHFWLALADYELGDVNDARQQLTLARDYSVTIKERSLYSAKLQAINAYRAKEAH